MWLFQVKRISRSLNIHRSTSNNTTDGTGPLQASDSAASGDGNLQTLRRQSTKELISKDESSFKSKVTSRSSVTSVRSSSIIGEVPRAKTMKSTPGNSRQASRRLSKPPSRLVEQDDVYPIGEGSLVKASSTSMSKSPSRQPTKKTSHQPSLSKAASNQGSISKTLSQQSRLSKAPSLSRSGSKSKSSVTKKTSVPAAPPGPAKKAKPGGKLLWFPAGAYLTVRNEEGACLSQSELMTRCECHVLLFGLCLCHSTAVTWVSPRALLDVKINKCINTPKHIAICVYLCV